MCLTSNYGGFREVLVGEFDGVSGWFAKLGEEVVGL